jgi:hypothetical protein
MPGMHEEARKARARARAQNKPKTAWFNCKSNR